MMKISVILIAYNEEKYIKKAIKSVLNQTFNDFELIIVDDGSSDNTLNIIKEFNDPRIVLISHDNIGPGASRNKAIKIANGDYLMFIDGDDWYSPDALEIAYEQSSSKNTDITIFQAINYDDSTAFTNKNDWFNLNNFDESFEDRVFSPEDTHDFLFDLSVSPCQKIYNTSFLKNSNVLFPEGIYFEDMPFFFELYLKASRISIIKKYLYFRRKHVGSITHTVDCKFLDTVPAGQELFRRFVKNDFYEDYKFDLIAFKINGPRIALNLIEDKCKSSLFDLIRKDYLKIKDSPYYQDFLDNLGPVKKNFFLNILKSKNYDDFLLK